MVAKNDKKDCSPQVMGWAAGPPSEPWELPIGSWENHSYRPRYLNGAVAAVEAGAAGSASWSVAPPEPRPQKKAEPRRAVATMERRTTSEVERDGRRQNAELEMDDKDLRK